MKKQRFFSAGVLALSCVGIFLLSASTNYKSSSNSVSLTDTAAQEPFTAPAWADTLKNPLGSNPDVIAKGAELYNLYCFACHGDTGYGDGPAGGALGVRPANFHDPKFGKQTDGSAFWKLTHGKGNMPPFKEVLSDEQRWQLTVYLKEFAKSK